MYSLYTGHYPIVKGVGDKYNINILTLLVLRLVLLIYVKPITMEYNDFCFKNQQILSINTLQQ